MREDIRLMLDSEDRVSIKQLVDGKPLLEKLPPGVWRPKFDQGGELVRFDKLKHHFKVPEVTFGLHSRRKQLVIDAMRRDDKTVGCIFTGVKGSGKTALAEDLGNFAMSSGGVPVIMVEGPLAAAKLYDIYLTIGRCVFYFDEFDSVYKTVDERNGLLTFFADQSIRDCLFLITTNTLGALPRPLIDRPGRFLFRFEFRQVDRTTAREVFKYHQVDPDYVTVLENLVDSTEVNMDVLLLLVNEAKRTASVEDFQFALTQYNIDRPTYRNFTVRFAGHVPADVLKCIDVARADQKYYLYYRDPSTQEKICFNYDSIHEYKDGVHLDMSIPGYEEFDGKVDVREKVVKSLSEWIGTTAICVAEDFFDDSETATSQSDGQKLRQSTLSVKHLPQAVSVVDMSSLYPVVGHVNGHDQAE